MEQHEPVVKVDIPKPSGAKSKLKKIVKGEIFRTRIKKKKE
jgi:hypothetical protein